MKKEHALYDKRVLRDIFGSNSEEERWRWRKLHNYSIPTGYYYYFLFYNWPLCYWIRT